MSNGEFESVGTPLFCCFDIPIVIPVVFGSEAMADHQCIWYTTTAQICPPQFFVGPARCPRLRKHLETGPRVANVPRHFHDWFGVLDVQPSRLYTSDY